MGFKTSTTRENEKKGRSFHFFLFGNSAKSLKNEVEAKVWEQLKCEMLSHAGGLRPFPYSYFFQRLKPPKLSFFFHSASIHVAKPSLVWLFTAYARRRLCSGVNLLVNLICTDSEDVSRLTICVKRFFFYFAIPTLYMPPRNKDTTKTCSFETTLSRDEK